MPSTKLFADDFEPASYADWRRRVEDSLSDVPFEKALVDRVGADIDVEPLYPAGDGELADDSAAAGLATSSRPGWQVVAEISSPDPAEARRALEQALQLGVGQLWLRIDPAATHGIALPTVAALDSLLEGVDPKFVALQLEAGFETPDWAATLMRWARQNGGVAGLRGGFGADPLGTLASRGGPVEGLDGVLDQWVDLVRKSLHEAPELRGGLVSTVAYHEAGASAVEELAYGLATGVLYLRRLVDAGVDIDAAATQLVFAFAIGSDCFVEIAKLRAARLLWAKVLGAGGASSAEMRIHARTSFATQTARHPAGNWLRATAQGFAAATGGADSLAVLPYDSVLGEPSRSGRRLSLTLQHVLAEEAHLGRVADPAAGSWYLESLTDRLARSAWQHFQQIESGGGMASWLLSGKVAERLAELATDRRRAVASRRQPIVGVSQFAALDEVTATRAADEPGARATGEREHFAALAPIRWSEPFEALREAADDQRDAAGELPRVFLANLGSLKEHSARTSFARDLLAAGGLQAVPGPSAEDDDAIVTAFAASGSVLTVLCGADEAYAERATALAAKLAKAGSRQVLIAGKPGEHEQAWREAGVTGFIHLGGDALAALALLHESLQPAAERTVEEEKP